MVHCLDLFYAVYDEPFFFTENKAFFEALKMVEKSKI